MDLTRRRGDVWAMAGGALGAAACVVVVWGGSLSDIERSVFLWINGLADWMKAPLWSAQLFGSLVPVVLLAVAALLMRRVRLGVAILAAFPLKLFFEWWVVKAVVERERPSLTVADAIVRETNSSSLGFPSGHAILAFSLAVMLMPYVGRRWKIAVLSLATLGGLGRIYLGAHNPLDVVAGAGLGIMVGSVLNLVAGVPSEPRSVEPEPDDAGSTRDRVEP